MTKNQTITDLVAEAEKNHVAKVKAFTKELADTKAKVKELKAEAEQAEDHLSGIRASFGRGDDTVTAEEFSTASANVERTELLVTGIERKLKGLEQAPPTDNKDVALLAAEAVTEALPYAAEVVPTFAVPRKPEDITEPVVVVVQERATSYERGFTLAPVKVIVYRKAHHKVTEASVIERAIRARGWRVVGQVRENHAGNVDTITIPRLLAFDKTPVIPADPSSREAQEAVSGIMIDAFRYVPKKDGKILSVGPRGKGIYGTEEFTIHLVDKDITSKTSGRKRETGVTAKLRIQAHSASGVVSSVEAGINAHLEQIQGTVIPGLGKVERSVIQRRDFDTHDSAGVVHVLEIQAVSMTG